ncbi:hypothetical protein H4K36_22155 [Streptomyces sp. DHE7-1]|nr:hypothetical protein [Streptomyces sp. DHE7-1]
MDAGLAAVLGAAVGAIGTGGAGVVAALLARSQSRTQLQAEHLRLIREPRKATYVAYAEAVQQEHDRLLEILSRTTVVARQGRSEALESFMAVAEQLYQDSDQQAGARKHLQAQVYIEGPSTVIGSAVDLASSQHDFKEAALACLQQLRRGSCPPELVDAMHEKRDVAYGKYLNYLYAASAVMQADGLNDVLRP